MKKLFVLFLIISISILMTVSVMAREKEVVKFDISTKSSDQPVIDTQNQPALAFGKFMPMNEKGALLKYRSLSLY